MAAGVEPRLPHHLRHVAYRIHMRGRTWGADDAAGVPTSDGPKVLDSLAQPLRRNACRGHHGIARVFRELREHPCPWVALGRVRPQRGTHHAPEGVRGRNERESLSPWTRTAVCWR